MSNPIQTLLEVVKSKRIGEPFGFTFADAIWLNVTLGMYQTLGIPLVLLNVVDAETQYPIRFDASNGRSGMMQRWECINKGNMFLCFEDFELAALITKTVKRKLLFRQEILYQPFMCVPVKAEPLVGTPTTKLEEAMNWLEMRYRKYQEVFPGLTSEKVVQAERNREIKLEDLSGGGSLTCSDCDYEIEVLVSAHGSTEPHFSSTYQCQACAKLKELDVFPDEKAGEACECGGALTRNHTLTCPKCRSVSVNYAMLYMA